MENTTLEKRAQLSEIIQRSRIQKGLSQEKLAEKVGCVRSTIDRLEKTKFSINTDLLFKIFEVNPTVLKAVLASGETDIYKISQKICALNPIVQSDNFKDYVATFKRVANIIKDVDTTVKLTIDEDLLENSEEKELYTKYNEVKFKSFITYDEELEALFALKPQLDSFFDNVFVNHENEKIKTNRKNLIGLVYQGFRKIADIKEITI